MYALLSENLRYSRAIVLFGLTVIAIFLPLIRHILSDLKFISVGTPKKKKAIVLGSTDEYNRITQVLSKTGDYEQFLKVSEAKNDVQAVGTLNDLEEIVRIHKVHEIIFSSKDLSPKQIIELMTRMSEWQVDFKIVGDAVIGSKTVYTDEPTFDIYINSIAKPVNKRNKRIFDVSTALFMLVFAPVFIIFTNHKRQFIKNIWQVLIGQKTWIGYAQPARSDLPKLKPCIVPVSFSNSELHKHEMNLLYAKDFKISFEIAYLFRNLKHLSSKPTI